MMGAATGFGDDVELAVLQPVVHDEAHERLAVHDQALVRGLRRQVRLRLAGQAWGSSRTGAGRRRGSPAPCRAWGRTACRRPPSSRGASASRPSWQSARARWARWPCGRPRPRTCPPSCPRTSKESPLRLLYRTRPARGGCLAGAAPCVASCAGRASCVHQRFAPARPWLPCVPAYDYAMLHLAINPLPSRHPLRNRHYSEEREPSRKEGAKMGQAALSPRAAHGAVEGGRRQARCTARRERAMPRGMAARRAREAGPTALRAAWTGGFTWPCDPLPE